MAEARKNVSLSVFRGFEAEGGYVLETGAVGTGNP